MNLMQLLAAATGKQPQLGGMAGAAQQIIASRPYQLHVQEARALGQEPLSPQEWAAQQQSNPLAKVAGQ
jgi:hypothetical protein